MVQGDCLADATMSVELIVNIIPLYYWYAASNFDGFWVTNKFESNTFESNKFESNKYLKYLSLEFVKYLFNWDTKKALMSLNCIDKGKQQESLAA